MKLDDELFRSMLAKADDNQRKRSHHNIHGSEADPVQRLCVALKKGTYVRPHHHKKQNKWELLLILSGSVNFVVFDNEGEIVEKMALSLDGNSRGLEVIPNTWHTVYPTSEEAVILEVKEGPYDRIKENEFATWAPQEGTSDVNAYLRWLESATVGDKYQV